MTASLAAAILLAWLRLLALDGYPGQSRAGSSLRRILHAAAWLVRQRTAPPPHTPRGLAMGQRYHGRLGTHHALWPRHSDQQRAVPAIKEGAPGAGGTPLTRPRRPGLCNTRPIRS